MLRIYKTVGMLAVVGILVGLFLFINSQPADPDTLSSNAIPQSMSEPTAEVQPSPNVAGQDPFKKFLDEKAGDANLTAKSNSSRALPVQQGKDPFKEFLEKQKQNSKDQVVSPFGKN